MTEVSSGTRIVRRGASPAPTRVSADICVIGSGAAGMSAALEGARAGRRVVLVDSLPALGG
jgi:succinate dehydrogenase/fumarate reductase flavoprotein subunit